MPHSQKPQYHRRVISQRIHLAGHYSTEGSSMLTLKGRSGQGLAEYALILALIAIAAVLALLFLSGTIQSILSAVGAAM
jgi:pilus assembly protein Flp/PilA